MSKLAAKPGRFLGATICFALAACGSAPLPELRPSRAFVVECALSSEARPQGGSLSLPIPVDDDDQELQALDVGAEGGAAVERFDARGNRSVEVRGTGPLTLRWRAVVVRFERAAPEAPHEDGATGRRARRAQGAVAREALAQSAGRAGVLGKARALFAAILEGRLRPEGASRAARLASALESVAIRTRVEHGVLLPSGAEALWLHLYVPGVGWLAADPDGEIGLGRLDARRIALGRGPGPTLPAGTRLRAREIGRSAR